MKKDEFHYPSPKIKEMKQIDKMKRKIYFKLVCSGIPPKKALSKASKASELFFEDLMRTKEEKYNTGCNNITKIFPDVPDIERNEVFRSFVERNY